MKRGLLLLLLAATAVAQEPPPESRVFVEVEAARDVRYVGERFGVLVRVGVDRAFFREHAIPLFRRRMDFAMKLVAPWLNEIEGLDVLEAGSATDAGHGRPRSFVVNDDVVRATRRADRVVGGRKLTVLEFESTFLARSPGRIELAAPTLSFAWTTEFHDDFMNGRRPIDRQDVVVTGPAISVDIREPPTAKPPEGYTDAVGNFTISATADKTEIEAGESLRLRLTVNGEGNLETFTPPRDLPLPGFHVYGQLSEYTDGRRILTYDIAPSDASVREIPSVAFAFFVPQPKEYRVIQSAPIPLVVRPKPGVETPVAPAPPSSADDASSGGYLAPFLLVVALAAGGFYVLRRRRRLRAEEPDASVLCLAGIDREGGDLAETIAAYLGERLGCPPAAVVSPDLPERLIAAGISDELAARTGRYVESLTAARYGGTVADGDTATARSLVVALESDFAAD